MPNYLIVIILLLTHIRRTKKYKLCKDKFYDKF